MGRIDDCIVYQCDRCKLTKWYQATDHDGMKDWYSATRVDATNTSHPLILCDRCWGEYQKLLQSIDVTFGKWMDDTEVRS